VQEKKRAGIDVISLGIGDPDMPTPGRIVSVLQETAADPSNHRYPSYFGLADLREAIARWYSERSGVELDPSTEILPTLGSKDGIAHAPLALVDPGDIVLAPDPGYTVYMTGALMAGGDPYVMPLTAANQWLPDLDAIPALETIDGHRAVGHDVEFISLDMTNTCAIRCFRTPRRTVLVFSQWSDLDAEENEALIQGVWRSFGESDR